MQDVLKEEDLPEETRLTLKRRLIDVKVELCDVTAEYTNLLTAKCDNLLKRKAEKELKEKETS